MSENGENTGSPLISDIAGVGKIINSEVANKTYDDALSPAMREVGGLSGDTMKALRLFTAPLQLAAAYQDRFRAFCDRVREKVPEQHQQEAPPEIVKPVMEAFASTSDASPLMEMFEELMAKAIDDRAADKLSPTFPDLIRSLSPLQAKLIKDLASRHHITDDLFKADEWLIIQRIGANFSYNDFGGPDHHLTLVQDLKEKNIVNIRDNVKIDKDEHYPTLTIPDGLRLVRTVTALSMFGRWFASACIARSISSEKSSRTTPP